MNKNHFIFGLSILCLLSISVPVRAIGTDTASCVTISQNIALGARDSATGGAVTTLQKFLAGQGIAIYPEGLVTGVFGPLTEKAVQRFQAAHSIVSSGTAATTGYGSIGPATRAVLGKSCAPSENHKAPLTVMAAQPTATRAAFDDATLMSTSTHPLITGTADQGLVGMIVVNDKNVGISGAWTIPVEDGHWSYAAPEQLLPGTYTLQLLTANGMVVKKLIVKNP